MLLVEHADEDPLGIWEWSSGNNRLLLTVKIWESSSLMRVRAEVMIIEISKYKREKAKNRSLGNIYT